MSQWLIQVRYTGPGPRSGSWLNAYDPGGFMVRDKCKTEFEAKRELRRLKAMAPQFHLPGSDWEARVLEEGAAPPQAAPTPPAPPARKEPSFAPAKPKPKKKKKAKAEPRAEPRDLPF